MQSLNQGDIVTTDRYPLKHLRRSKQVVLLQNATWEFQILPSGDGKSFLLPHWQTIDIQSCVINK